ncbi:MAG: hypothetical protein GWN84_06735 [Gammaproteobacteria bacterium]|nr:hypothetical protein [Gammaproteobacteria bacterium]NIR82606.1 hypothetical protein [Gammaproteobacteria bacterium]NIU03719.1 hypothetical protein [Gammaproteobacteria bacterium]NIV51046.1 hypothetical protein [Gammaproteobacteria bacterium]NIX84993.1 hypothetical protein [Gammaproteobacteria bacterium]
MPTHEAIERYATELGLFAELAGIDELVGEVWEEVDQEGLEIRDDDDVLAHLVPRFTKQLVRRGLLEAFNRLTERMKAEGYDFALNPGPMNLERH